MQLVSPQRPIAPGAAREPLLAALLRASASAEPSASPDGDAAGWAHSLRHALQCVAHAPIIGFFRREGQPGSPAGAVVFTHARVADWEWEERPQHATWHLAHIARV
jgi:hypothetical protein